MWQIVVLNSISVIKKTKQNKNNKKGLNTGSLRTEYDI